MAKGKEKAKEGDNDPVDQQLGKLTRSNLPKPKTRSAGLDACINCVRVFLNTLGDALVKTDADNQFEFPSVSCAFGNPGASRYDRCAGASKTICSAYVLRAIHLRFSANSV